MKPDWFGLPFPQEITEQLPVDYLIINALILSKAPTKLKKSKHFANANKKFVPKRK